MSVRCFVAALQSSIPAHNHVQGTIPEAFRRLQSLTRLALDSNLMYGTIPGWLDELQSLQSLSLAGFRGA